MDILAIEQKWKKYWDDNHVDAFNKKKTDKKYYVLEMFSYPSGSNLHLGHWYNYAPTDSFARFKRMQGYDVFQPMGFDAFGLPAENFAIKTGIHPKDSTMKNIATMERQLKEMGASFDWDSELYTCSPEYYRWTQWLFLKLYEKGLCYQKLSPVNFCSSCQTVIANEQVVDGKCERCGAEVVRKELTQWFFKITDYAEELLTRLDTLDWPEKTKLMQRNWIGKSVGGEVEFTLENGEPLKVFTTRADTLYGVSYVVLAPEHPYVSLITTPEQKAAVDAYVLQTAKSSDIERQSSVKEKTGVFTGAYCINPVNKQKVPVWIADYCLATYGTGAVMGVAAHDTRDYDFACKYHLPIKRVIVSDTDLPYCGDGVMTGSEEFDGMDNVSARKAILEKLAKLKKGGEKINYRLRDWSVSRQRYWGAPIPVIHCEHCGAVPVPEKDLPVQLPYNVNFAPNGKSPLGTCEEFINTVCPVCGKPAKRDADTLDTFVCSSWYFLRYPDNKNSEKPFDSELINKMLPVDKYVGGAEHACMHLLYSRFITKALRDMGYLNFDEPFTSLVHQGLILGSDGNKMSKSKGNVVNPDIYIKEYGSDTFRLYLMFGFSFIEGGPWDDNGIKGIQKFIERTERLVEKVKDNHAKPAVYGAAEKELDYIVNRSIQSINSDLEIFSFNTAIARIMELVNGIYKYDATANRDIAFMKGAVRTMALLLAPFTPHIAEEYHQLLGGKGSVFQQQYPVCDSSKLVLDQVEIAVQINSKVRCKLVVPSAADNAALEKIALSDEKVLEALNGAAVKKVIIIPNRLINLVI